MLNGLSSNVVADATSAPASKTATFWTILDDLTRKSHDGIIVIAVHSTDGLWTNIYAFLKFFAPYVEKMPLNYMIHEGFGSHRMFS